jgi:hypothetical protein
LFVENEKSNVTKAGELGFVSERIYGTVNIFEVRDAEVGDAGLRN